jgi:hypothetical protein
MNDTNKEFIERLAHIIVDLANIPKVQVERIVGPVLSIFIAEIINKLLNVPNNSADKIELVAPEWPLKKDENNQSTNIDWLFVQPSKDRFFFVELKTDSSSEDPKQLSIYRTIIDRVSKNSAGYLLVDLERIRNASSDGWKYDYVMKMAEPYRKTFSSSKEIQLIYIVPKKMKAKLENETVRTFALSDLPEQLDDPMNDSWKIIRSALVALEEMHRNKIHDVKLFLPTNNSDPDYSQLSKIIATRLENDNEN